MKLIDILNLIAKGELEEGTKVEIGCIVFVYRNGRLENGNLYPLFTSTYISKSALLQEVEIISKDTNAATKIEELTLEKSDLACQGIHAGDLFRNIESKLNEVIRELNRRGE